ncbi:MAG: DUF169 domain-containing protein [Candidatus Rokubacteria bacterium]|nr:DUF169 domain-containing protein [Candidatus Rokubacteria bacterium]
MTARAGTHLQELLGLSRPPVAVAFLPAAPPGVRRVAHAGPAGCAYWKLAQEGHVFYTEAGDHQNCPVGAHTHGVPLRPDTAKELEGVVSTMVGLQYIRMSEVAALPRRTAPFGVAVYAPVAQAPCPPDLVLVRGNARQIMLLSEAALAVGVAHDGAVMGRPACAMIPATLESAKGTTSLGCIGNRVYTGLADDELYYAVPAAALAAVEQKLGTILRANRELATYHEGRRASLGPARAR